MYADIAVSQNLYMQSAPCTVNPLWCSYCVLDRWNHEGLSSPYWRWYWNDRSGASIGFESRRLSLDPAHVVLIPPNTVFSTHTERQVGHFHCHFWLNTRPAGKTALPVRLQLGAADRARLWALVRGLDHEDDRRREPRVSLAILSLVADALARAGYDWDVQNHDPLIDRVRQRLYAAAAHRHLDNSTLARESGLSVNTLLRRFRRATGTSPRQFLIQLRVERAAELMRSADKSIPEVADLCGFVDRYHFSRTFTAHTGTSPAAFRRRYRTTDPVPAA